MKFTRYIKMIGITALAACLFAPSASAQTYHDTQCYNYWNNSPASHNCPGAGVSYVGEFDAPAKAQKCRVSGTCSVEVEGQTFSESFTVEHLKSNVSSLQLCFEQVMTGADEKGATFTWELRLLLDCVPAPRVIYAGEAARLGFPAVKK